MPIFTWRPLAHRRTSVEPGDCAWHRDRTGQAERSWGHRWQWLLDRFDGVEPDAAAVAGALRRATRPDGSAVPDLRRRASGRRPAGAANGRSTRSPATSWTSPTSRRRCSGAGRRGRRTAASILGATPATWLEASDEVRRPARPSPRSRPRRSDEQARATASVCSSPTAATSCLPGPYGPLHWSTLGAHLFWDAWLHERDIVARARLARTSRSAAEDRLAALYGLAISSTAPTFFGSPSRSRSSSADRARASTRSRPGRTPRRAARGGTGEAATAQAELGPFLDSLAGRGGAISMWSTRPLRSSSR